MNKSLLMTALITGMCTWGGIISPAFAEDLEEYTLDQMIVTAQRMETKDVDTPAAVSIITSNDIENSGAKTAYEIIERQVGFSNNSYGPSGREYGGSCSRTVMRGLDKGTLVMVNGAPINMLNYNSMEGIPAESIEKIEIVRGANSVLYGAEAFGGVVNIITKKGGKDKTTISLAAGNYDKKWSLNQSGKNYTVYVSKDYYGDIDRTNKLFPKSTKLWKSRDSSKDSAFVTIAPTDKLSFNFAHTEGDYYRDCWTLSNGKETGGGTAYYYKDVRDNVSMTYDDKENLFKSVVSYNKRVVDPYQAVIKDSKIQNMKRASSSDWKMDSMTWDTQKGWNLRDDKDYFVAGMALQKDNVEDRTKDKDGERSSVAVYGSYKHQFSDMFSATIGARGQFIDDEAKDQNVFLPQLQTLYKFNDTASWYVNIGKSFQMPALNQYFTPGRTSALKPQEGWTYETGLKFIDDKSSLKLGVYYMDIDGKFEWIDIGLDEKVLMNAGKFKNNGVEVEYNRKLSDALSYNFGASISNPRTQAYGKSSFEQSDAQLQLTAGLTHKWNKLTSNINYLYLGNREKSFYLNSGLKGSDHAVPSRNLLNANFIYKANESNSVSLTLNNILDKDDAVNKYENWGMPFNWMLTYNYTF